MNKWLTTGEIIDTLKVGEVAENVNGIFKMYWEADEERNTKVLKFKNAYDDEITEYLQMEDQNEKWRILPNYVSFEEAMKAHVNGIGVRFHPSENQSIYIGSKSNMRLKDGWLSNYTLSDLVSGKWSIKS